MTATDPISDSTEPDTRLLVTFHVQSTCYAVPIETVVEMTILRDFDPIVGGSGMDPGNDAASR
jgi:hypothetical protein